MLALGLTERQREIFEETLQTTHEVRVDVRVLDLDHKVVSTVSAVLLDGSVNVDAEADVTRSASLTFLDPRHSLKFDPEDPDDGAVFLNRMIQIDYAVHVPRLNRWVSVPVFTGPITSLSRDGAIVQVEAQGKESLAVQAVWTTFTRPKGTAYADVIKGLLQSIGETKFGFTDPTSKKIPKAYTLALNEREFANEKNAKKYRKRTTEVVGRPIWEAAQTLTRAIGRQLFYDGRGVARLRATGGNPVFVFKAGNGGAVLTQPQVTYSIDGLRNAVQVKRSYTTTTGKGKDKKEQEHTRYVRVEPPASHPLSPAALGRNGKKRYLPEVIDGGNISAKDAENMAKNRLDNLLSEAVEVRFDALPIPHLEPGDRVRLKAEEIDVTFPMRTWSIPLVPGPMSVGYTKRSLGMSAAQRKKTRVSIKKGLR